MIWSLSVSIRAKIFRVQPAEYSLKTCRICERSGVFPSHFAKERMFETLQPFGYFLCSDCGTLQIVQVPDDLSAYYPAAYYTYQRGQPAAWKAWLRQQRNRALLNPLMAPSRFLTYLQPYEALASLASLPLHRHSRILDVGAGQGVLVSALRELGYRDVTGIDPLADPQNKQVLATDLSDLEQGPFDLIMFHHSLEHVANPGGLLAEARQRLSPRGQIVVRVPLVDSWAFQTYGHDWVQWDPPRHLYLFSRRGLTILAQQQGLKLLRSWDDSTVFQFWASERYRKGQALQRPFSLTEATKCLYWKRRALALNRCGLGDQGVFVLQR